MDSDFDPDIGRWILEFLLRQPLDDHLLNFLVRILPLPGDDNLSFKKALLLRKVESEAANGSVSEAILDLLQQIEELDFRAGIEEQSSAIKAAYLAVAVDCTVRFLRKSGRDSKFEYLDAVKRIWRGRICKLEKAEMVVGLVSEELWSWKDDIMSAVWEDTAVDIVLKRSERIDPVSAVRACVREERGKMGPSFLESLAEAVKTDEDLRVLIGNPGLVREKVARLQSDREVQKGHEIPRWKHNAVKRRRVLVGPQRGARITDTDTPESNADESCRKYYLPSTPEVNEVLKALESSSLDLQAVVKDPLPNSLRVADNVVSEMTRKSAISEALEEKHIRADPPVTQSSTPAQSNGNDLPSHAYGPENNAPKLNLMAGNSTAHTFEWDDTVDDFPSSPNEVSRPQLPSPKRRPVSPLKIYESGQFARRRKPKRWSKLEEDTLRDGVKKYGTGNWNLILKSYSDVFEERTGVDLKDKWRNLVR